MGQVPLSELYAQGFERYMWDRLDRTIFQVLPVCALRKLGVAPQLNLWFCLCH